MSLGKVPRPCSINPAEANCKCLYLRILQGQQYGFLRLKMLCLSVAYETVCPCFISSNFCLSLLLSLPFPTFTLSTRPIFRSLFLFLFKFFPFNWFNRLHLMLYTPELPHVVDMLLVVIPAPLPSFLIIILLSPFYFFARLYRFGSQSGRTNRGFILASIFKPTNEPAFFVLLRSSYRRLSCGFPLTPRLLFCYFCLQLD